MSQKLLRSRTVDILSEEMDLGSREESQDWPSDQLDPVERTQGPELTTNASFETGNSGEDPGFTQLSPPVAVEKSDSFKLQDLMTNIQALFQKEEMKAEERARKEKAEAEERARRSEENIQKLFEALKNDQKEMQEKLQTQITGVRDEVQVNRVEIDKRLVQMQESGEKRLREEIEQVRQDCQRSHDQSRERLSAELTKEIRQVREATSQREGRWERELIGAKEQMETDKKGFEGKLKELAAHHEVVSESLQQQIITNKERADNNIAEIGKEVTGLSLGLQQAQEKIDKLTTVGSEVASLSSSLQQVQEKLEISMDEASRRLGERASQIEQRISEGQLRTNKELKRIEQEAEKFRQELGRSVFVANMEATPLPARRETVTDTVINPGEASVENICEGQSERFKENISFGSGEFALPLFDENAGVNPMSHLRCLEEFFQFRGTPQRLWLTVAKRSMTGPMSKQWMEARSLQFTDYKQFKAEFLSTWWSPAQQGLTRCSLYQSKFDKGAGLSLSAHFLKYVNLASYLEPKLTDNEVIEAVRCHYPPEIQRSLASNRLSTVAEVLEVLKRLELIEERATIPIVGTRIAPNRPNSPPVRMGNDRFRGYPPVRQVQGYTPRTRGGWRSSRGRGSYAGRNDWREEERVGGEEPPNEDQIHQERERDFRNSRRGDPEEN